MMLRTQAWVIVLGLATAAVRGVAASVPVDASAAGDDSGNADMNRYEAAERTLYDTLSMDPSPRTQVLAGRVNLSEKDEATPAALRPKKAEVIAQAAQRDTGDAFVQWMAASQGSYFSSQCGPTVWPEAEVANLVRLEPDNAAAWQFAVALAAAKGSQSGVDDALAQMASAPMADDHYSDELAAWKDVYSTHPELVPSRDDEDEDAAAPSPSSPLFAALQRVGWRNQPAASALETVCKPDAENEITWQRAAWCADAATVFATRGTSLQLRKQGLSLLVVVGDRSPEVADLQRTQTWLSENTASPAGNWRAADDNDADRAADWRGNANDVVATERRLKRLGQPLTAPMGWVSPEDQQASDERAAMTAWQTHLRSLVAAMRESRDADTQAAAALAVSTIGQFAGASTAQTASGGITAEANPTQEMANADAARALSVLVHAHPERPLVQWLAAGSLQLKVDARADAIANLQRLEPDNAAAWALSLDAKVDDSDALRRAAGGSHFDSHTSELLRVWLDAVTAYPPPPEVADKLRAREPFAAMSTDESALIGIAATMAFTAIEGTAPVAVSRRCSPASAGAKPADREPCIALARVMLHAGTSVLTELFGEVALRKFDALEPADVSLAAEIRNAEVASTSFDGAALARYVREYVASGSEITAMRLAMDSSTAPASAESSKAK